MAKLNVKKGDAVQVISGKDKGKTGQISKIDTGSGRVIVEGINIVTKHVKPKKAQEKGGRIEQAASIDSSNVMIVCPACKIPTRVGNKVVEENGKQVKIRVCKQCGASLEVAVSKTKTTAKKATKKTKTSKSETTKAVKSSATKAVKSEKTKAKAEKIESVDAE